MKKIFSVSIFYLTVASLFLLFSNCDDNGVTEPQSGIGDELIINASSKTEWVYFSFSKGDMLTVDDPSNSLEWDLGLKRYRLKTNSGTSGSGQGGAVNIGKVDFDSVVEAPGNGYMADDSLTYQSHGSSKTISTSQILNGWAIMQGMPPTFIPTDSIYVVKTAGGKYARLWFKSYYHPTESTSGYITLQYFYQSDGSRDLNE
jgi:hypothetical protein